MLSFRENVTPDDLKTVRQILESTGFFDEAPDEIDIALELVQAGLDKGCSPDNYAFLFLEEDGQTLGYGCYARVPCTVSTFELYWLAVRNDQRGKGLGKKLMNKFIEKAKSYGATKVVLSTAGDDELIYSIDFA